MDMNATPLDGEVAADGIAEKPDSFDDLIAPLPRLGAPSPNNLAVHRWYGPILEAGEEADLVRRAQAGDGRAKTRLLESFHRCILKLARRFIPDPRLKLDAPYIGDLVAAGGIGLLQALHRFDLRLPYRLYAYAKSYIENEIRKEATRWKSGGFAGETRIDRWVRSHPYDTPEEIAAALSSRGIRCTVEAAASVIEAISSRRRQQSYSTTTESSYSDDLDGSQSKRSSVKPATSHDWHRFYSCFSQYRLAPQLRLHERVSRIIDTLAVQADLRAMRRLARIGRRKYAAELVAKDRAPVVPLFDVGVATGYSIPVNTADTAEPPFDPIPKPSPAPLVWSERDRWGLWRRISQLPDDSETSKASAKRRMTNLVIAVDNEDQNGQFNNAVQPGGALYRADRGNGRGYRQGNRAAR